MLSPPKRTFIPSFAIFVIFIGVSFGRLAQASDELVVLDYICTTYESARQVALEQSWQNPKNMPGDCRTLFQLSYELRVANVLQIVEIIIVGEGRWVEIGRVRRSEFELGYSAGLAEALVLF